MRKNHAIAMLLGSSAVLLAALAGNGQERLGLAGRGDSLRLSLLRTPEVQKALKLSASQIEKITRLEAESKETKKRFELTYKGEKGKPKAKPGEPQTEEDRLAKTARESALDGLERQADERLDEILDARQRTRLTQIVLRVQGPSAFLTPEVIEKLGLTPDQVQSIGEILGTIKGEQDQYKESQKRASELAKAGGDFELEKVRKEQEKGRSRAVAYKLGKMAMPEIGRILTRYQRGMYNKMLGDPFDLATLTGRDGTPLFDEAADLRPWLLKQAPVQQELGLSPTQRQRIAAGDPEAKVLDSKQRGRLGELELQADGISALARPEVIRALRLEPEQLEQIRMSLDGLVEETKRLRDAIKAAPPEPGPDGLDEAALKEQTKAKERRETEQLRGEFGRRIDAFLTRKQWQQFRRMLGEPFDFTKLRPAPEPPGP